MTFEKSVNIPKFLSFLEKLKKDNKKRRLCLFLDNLSVHKNKDVIATMERLNFKFIFNAPYSPEFNGIEFIFAKVKRLFKVKKLRQISNNSHTSVD